MDRFYKADIIAARFMLMCLFMPAHLQVYAAIGAAAWFTGRTIQAGVRPQRSALWLAFLLGGGYLFYVVAVPLSPASARRAAAALCERRAAYLLMPFLFAIMAPRFRAVLRGQLMYFVYGTLITCVVVNLAYLYHHFIAHDAAGQLSHVVYRVMIERFTGIHPTYLSMYLCFSICILLSAGAGSSRRGQVLHYLFLYLMLAFMLAMFAKSPLIALAIIAVHYAFLHRRQLHQFGWAFAGLGGVVAAASYFVPFVRQRAAEILGLFGGGTSAQITDNSVNVRKLLFSTDMAMLRHYWLTGTGPGRLLDRLHQRYFFHSIYRGYWVGYFDPHSQYFYEWLSLGLAGIVYLLVVLAVQFRRAVLSRQHIYLYLLVMLVVVFFTESLLARQQGVLFYAIFTSLLFFSTPPPAPGQKMR